MLRRVKSLFTTIKGRMYFSTGVCTAFLLILVFTFFDDGFKNAERSARSIFEADSAYIGEYLNESLLDIRMEMQNLVYNETMQRYLFTQDMLECLQFQSAANQLIDRVIDNSNIITHVFVLGRGTRHIYTPAASAHYSYIEQFKQSIGDEENRNPFFSDIYVLNNKPCIFYVYPFYYTSNRSERGLGIFCCDISGLIGFFRPMPDEYSVMTFVQKGESILSTRPLTQKEMETLAAAYHAYDAEEGNTFIHSDSRFLAFISRYTLLGCDIAVITHKSEIIIQILKSKWTLYMFLCLACVVVSLVMLRTSKLISCQLQTMERDISRLSTFDKGNEIRVPSLSELNTLAQTINSMLYRLKQNAEERQRAEERELSLALALKQSELQFYRIQIRPHFLFNTLECISGMAHYEGNQSLQNITQSLISTLRYAVYQKEISTVQMEIENASDYMCIIRERKPGKYQLRLSVQENILGTPMPSMLLQPLVGNAVKHGFSGTKKPPHIILIRGYQEEDRCVLEVTDNGSGMSEKKLGEVIARMKEERIAEVSEQGIGLQNVFQRLRLIYAQDFSFSIESREGAYTRVRIAFPRVVPRS